MVFRHRRVKLWIALLLTIMVITVTGCGGSSKVVAEVKGEKITRAELDAYMDILRLFMPNLEPMLSDKSRRGMIEGDILGAMVEDLLLKQAVKELGFTVTDSEVQEVFDAYKSQLIGMFGSEEAYNAKIKEYKIKEKDLVLFIGSSVYSDKLNEHFEQSLSEDDVRAFIAENPEYGRKPAELELSHIQFDTKEDALAAKERHQSGEDFGDLAEELSKDRRATTSAHSGYRGYLGDNIPEDTETIWPEVIGATKDLAAGVVSVPVKSAVGWHLVLLHKRVEAQDLTFAEAREGATVAAAKARASQHFNDYYDNADVKLLLN